MGIMRASVNYDGQEGTAIEGIALFHRKAQIPLASRHLAEALAQCTWSNSQQMEPRNCPTIRQLPL
jgi:hypothetical protein